MKTRVKRTLNEEQKQEISEKKKEGKERSIKTKQKKRFGKLKKTL